MCVPKRSASNPSSSSSNGEEQQQQAGPSHKIARLVIRQGEAATPLNQAGVAKMDSGLYDEAERYFKKALHHVEKAPISLSRPSPVPNAPTDVKAQHDQQGSEKSDNSASNYYDEGMCVYDNALSLTEDAEKQEALAYARVAYNIGQTFVRRDTFDMAKSWFDVALSRLSAPRSLDQEQQGFMGRGRNLEGKERAQTELCLLHNLGYCLYRLGQKMEATAMYHKALSLAQRADLGRLHVASSQNAVAVLIYYQQEEKSPDEALYNQASSLFQESIVVHEAEFGADSTQLATVLNNLGRLHFKNAKYAEALVAYRSALSIRRHKLEADSLDVAATICNMGQALHKNGEPTEAHSFYQEFLTIIENRDDSHRVASRCRSDSEASGRPTPRRWPLT